MKVVRSFSRHPPRGTHAPQSIIYGTPNGEHTESNSANRVKFESNDVAMSECKTLRLIVFSDQLNCLLPERELFRRNFVDRLLCREGVCHPIC